jgi:hypothetical protein
MDIHGYDTTDQFKDKVNRLNGGVLVDLEKCGSLF